MTTVNNLDTRVASLTGRVEQLEGMKASVRELRDMLSVLNPIVSMFSGLFGSTIGRERQSHASMLLPLILAGAMSSDAIGHPTSGFRGATLLDQARAYETAHADLVSQAQAVVDHAETNGITSKKKVPEPRTSKDFINRDTELKNELAANSRNAVAAGINYEAQSAAIKEHFVSPALEAIKKQLQYEQKLASNTQAGKNQATKALELAQRITKIPQDMTIDSIKTDAEAIATHEKTIAEKQALATSLFRLPTTRTLALKDATAAQEAIKSIHAKYQIAS